MRYINIYQISIFFQLIIFCRSGYTILAISMPLINNTKLTLTILYFLNICPFRFISGTNILNTNRIINFFSIIFLFFYSIGLGYCAFITLINYTTEFGNVLSMTCTIFINLIFSLYLAFLLACLTQRHNHAKFLIRLNDNELKLQLFMNKQCFQLNGHFRMSVVFMVTFFFIWISMHITWNYQFNQIDINLIIVSISNSFLYLIPMIISEYIRFLGNHLLSQMKLFNSILKKLFQTDLSILSNYKELMKAFSAMEDIVKLKHLFQKSFTYHFLLVILCDFIVITFTIFITIGALTQLAFNFIPLMCGLLITVPYVVKVVVFIDILDTIGNQVIIIFFTKT